MPIIGVTPKIRVAFISAETEHCLVGGLAEVAKSLPVALQMKGINVTRFTPLHSVVWPSAGENLRAINFSNNPEVLLSGKKIGVAAYELHNASVPTVYFKDAVTGSELDLLESPSARNIFLESGQSVGPMTEAAMRNACFSRFFYQGRVYPAGADLGEKFFFASRAVMELIKTGQFGQFDLIHFQDWHFSMIPVLIKYDPRYQELAGITTVGTIHNIYSWSYPPEKFEALSGLKQSDHPELYLPTNGAGLFHNNEIHFFKGLLHADMVNTVSPTYALEILTLGLKDIFYDFLRNLFDNNQFVGILNGIDERWNPVGDPFIAARFSPDDFSGKAVCKTDLRKEFRLDNHVDTPVIGVLSRITPQKGFDILIPCVGQLVGMGVQFVFFGSGDDLGYIHQLENLSRWYPGMVAFRNGADGGEDLPHKVYGGCDMFVRPSFYEPCGLSQMMAMKYGAVPIVHKTGGLADTVIDIDEKPARGNGFAFRDYTQEALLERIQRALKIFRYEPELWQTLMLRGMRADYSWERSVEQYLNLYQRALEFARKRNGKS